MDHIFIGFVDFSWVRRRVVPCLLVPHLRIQLMLRMGFEPVLSYEDDVGGDESDELDEEDVVDKSGDHNRNEVFRIANVSESPSLMRCGF